MEVRSDFNIALEVRTPDGQRHKLGKFHHEHVEEEVYEMEGERRMEAVPHLLRTHPSEPVLAALDPERAGFTILRFDDEGNVAARHELHLEGVEGRPRQFRWLTSTQGVAVATDEEVYLVSFDAADPPSRARAEPILGALPFDGSTRIVDTRTLDSGLLVRADQMEADEGWYRAQVFHVGLADGAVQQIDPLVGPDTHVMGANVGSEGAITLVAENYGDEVDDPAAQTPDNTSGIWIFAAPKPGEAPQPVQRFACPDDSCWAISNWSPGSDHLTFATDGDVHMRAYDSAREWTFSPEYDEDDHYTVDTLWVNHAGTRIVSATGTRLSMWSPESNEELMTWKAPKGTTIQGAHFDLDDEHLIVAAGKKVYRVDPSGTATRLAGMRGKYRAPRASDWGEGKRSFVDQAIPLPGGGLAMAVVDLEQTWESADEHWEAEMWEEDLVPVPSDTDLADPFAKRD